MRYSAQSRIINADAQKKLEESCVAVIGCGGLGTQVSVNLVSAGVGNLILVDSDVISESNLNRQFLYHNNIGKKKVSVIEDELKKMNHLLSIETYDSMFDSSSFDLLDNADVVVDCLDNSKSRLILIEGCKKKNKILVHGGIDGFNGQVAIITPDNDVYKDIITKDTQTSAVSLPSCVSFIGSIQSNEVIKIITGIGEVLDSLLVADLSDNSVRKIKLNNSL